MSSPMIASCRPTCPMVLEEWEPGVPDTENVHPLSKETSGWPLRRSGQLLGTDSSPCTSSFRNQPWPKFLLKESLSDEEKGKEEEMEEDDSSFKLCVPGIVPLQSPLHKTFRSTDTVGFVESELKKLLIVQRESGLWKMGSHEGQELLTQPEITLEEAGIVDGQHLLLEEMDEMGNWPP